MVYHLGNVVSLFNIAVEHAADKIDTLVAHSEGNSQVSIHDLVDAVKRVFFVNDCV